MINQSKVTTLNNMMELRMKVRASLKPLINTPGKTAMVAHIEDDIKKALETLADKRFMKVETLVDDIIEQFKPKYEDIQYFLKGEYEKTFVQRMQKYITPPKPKSFVNYQINEKNFNRINGMKIFYNAVNRSKILRHILLQYLKGVGEYVET